MIKRVYAVYDSMAMEMFGPLLLMPNDSAARRFFQDAVTGEGSQLAQHPEDYALCCLGELDTETGVMVSIPAGDKFGVQIASADQILELLKRREANAQVSGEASLNG